MTTPRAKAAKVIDAAPAESSAPRGARKSEAQRPEFNQAEAVVNSLTRQNAEQAKQIALLEAAVQERDAFLEANAELLGLEVGSRDDQGDES